MGISKMMSGVDVLMGDNTIPGIRVPKEIREHIPRIMAECRDFGLDFFPTIVESLTYDEISEVAAYGGFPVRYPHWRFGMEYEELSKGYEYGQHRILEMVVNTNPCYIYCLDSNTQVDNITVIAHALGHNDFFKNNVYFSATNKNGMNKLANHGTRIRKYIATWGKEEVTAFIDNVMRIETLVNPFKAWDHKEYVDPVITDKREFFFPRRRELEPDRNYMEPWLNTKEDRDKEWKRIKNDEVKKRLDVFPKPDRDIFGYIKDHGKFEPWQQDIISMLYEETMQFVPQRMTKMLNEGWASYVDHEIMSRRGLVNLGQPTEDCGIIEYASRKTGVLGGKYSMNPYKLGFCLFRDIEERWDKGMFGSEWEDCKDAKERENWDKKLGLGKQKIFEVRKCYNDATALMEFFTQEFCDKYEFFEWKKFPNGEYKIVSRDADEIRRKLVKKYQNGGLPDIRLTDPNLLGRGFLCLQHYWSGDALHDSFARETLTSLWRLWGNVIVLGTKDKDGNEMVYVCEDKDPSLVLYMTRSDYEKQARKEIHKH